jgi:hypothetical protein
LPKVQKPIPEVAPQPVDERQGILEFDPLGEALDCLAGLMDGSVFDVPNSALKAPGVADGINGQSKEAAPAANGHTFKFEHIFRGPKSKKPAGNGPSTAPVASPAPEGPPAGDESKPA